MVTTRVGHLVTVPGHAVVWEGLLNGGERAPTGEEGVPAGGGGGEESRSGSQIFSPPQPTGHRLCCRALWVTSTARAIYKA